MGKKPATELNNFIQKLATWLQNNKPDFVKSYNVSVSTYKSGDDENTIRFTTNFVTSNSEIQKLHNAGLIESEFE